MEGKPLNDVVQGINQRLATLHLPPGYAITQGGEARDQNEVFTGSFSPWASRCCSCT